MAEQSAPYLCKELRVPCVHYDRTFIAQDDAKALYEELQKSVGWEKSPGTNRMTALFGDDGLDYRYRDMPSSGVLPWTPTLLAVKERVEAWCSAQLQLDKDKDKDKDEGEGEGDTTSASVKFNVVLLNYYRNGQDRIGWHFDREEIGRTTPIASVSLGTERRFQIRHKRRHGDAADIPLEAGSILVMENRCQHEYVHGVPRDRDVTDGRINLTFRCTQERTQGEADHERHGQAMHDAMGDEEADADEYTGDEAAGAGRAVAGHASGVAGWIARLASVGDGDTISRFALPAAAFALGCAAAHMSAGAGADAGGSRGGYWGRFGRTGVATLAGVGGMAVGMLGSTAVIAGGGSERAGAASSTPTWATATSRRSVVVPEGAPQFLVLVHFGVEDLAAQEAQEELDAAAHGCATLARPWGVRGCVAVHCGRAATASASAWAKVERALLSLRSATHVVRHHGHFRLPKQCTPQQMYELTRAKLESEELVIASLREPGVRTFRVTCDRSGRHGDATLTSTAVQREAGGAMQEYAGHGPAPGKLEAKMKGFDVNVRVDIVGSAALVGTQLNAVDLSKRHKYAYVNRVTIKSNLAYILLRLARLRAGMSLLDPFCGSGTIPLEAAAMLRNDVRCVGVDVSQKAVNGAADNARAESVPEDVCRFERCDVRIIRKSFDAQSFDAIVTNMPWGQQTGPREASQLPELYDKFLRNAMHLLKPGGVLVMLVLRGLEMLEILRRFGRLRVVDVRVVKTSNNLPTILTVERLEEDTQREELWQELKAVGRYVDMSTSTFLAVRGSQSQSQPQSQSQSQPQSQPTSEA